MKNFVSLSAAIIGLLAFLSNCSGQLYPPRCTIGERDVDIPDTKCCSRYFNCNNEIATHHECPSGSHFDGYYSNSCKPTNEGRCIREVLKPPMLPEEDCSTLYEPTSYKTTAAPIESEPSATTENIESEPAKTTSSPDTALAALYRYIAALFSQ